MGEPGSLLADDTSPLLAAGSHGGSATLRRKDGRATVRAGVSITADSIAGFGEFPAAVVFVGADLGRLAALKLLLPERGRIRLIGTARAALRVISELPFKLVVFDNSLGPVFGQTFLQAVQVCLPAARVIITSTAPETAIVPKDPLLNEQWKVVIKPYRVDDLARHVERTLYVYGSRPAPVRSRTGYVLDAVDYVSQHYRERRIVQRTSAALAVSTTYLAHVFPREIGLTLKKFATWIRVEVAASLLRETRESLDDVADKVGFDNAPHLSRVFKQYTAYSPGQYRRESSVGGPPMDDPPRTRVAPNGEPRYVECEAVVAPCRRPRRPGETASRARLTVRGADGAGWDLDPKLPPGAVG
jgi:AraC-like DNA-binding protein